MAAAKPLLQRATSWLWATVKAQPLATALMFPLAVLAMQVHWQREDAETLRTHTVQDTRVAEFQTSGKSLDEALASYLDAVVTLGLAERKLAEPGAFSTVSVADAQAAVLTARTEAQKAIRKHASDIKALRGIVSPVTANSYINDLAKMTDIIDNEHNVLEVGAYTTTFGRLLKSRDELLDSRTDQ